MTNIPSYQERPVDGNTGQFSLPWRRWLEAVNVALNTAGSDTTGLAADVAAIATALGSPDGSVANIPDQDTLDVVIVGRNGVTVTGKAGVTTVNVELTPLDDSGIGAALLKFTRDAYGRLEGTQAATTDDLDEGSTNKYFTDERAQDAVAAAFAAGTQTGCTVTYNDGSNSLSIAVTGGGSGAMALVGTATVTGSPATVLTLTGLDLATDGAYYVVYSLAATAGSAVTTHMYFSGDTTSTHYYHQEILANGITVNGNGGRINNSVVFGASASATTTGRMDITLDVLGCARAFLTSSRDTGASMLLQMYALQKTVAGNVTSISLVSAAGTMAVGSYFKVFKVN